MTTPTPNTSLEKATPAHTPGPWAVESAIGRDVISGNGKAVAQIEPWMQSEHKEANARLIAAAPMMLDLFLVISAGGSPLTFRDALCAWATRYGIELPECSNADELKRSAIDAAIRKAEKTA